MVPFPNGEDGKLSRKVGEKLFIREAGQIGWSVGIKGLVEGNEIKIKLKIWDGDNADFFLYSYKPKP